MPFFYFKYSNISFFLLFFLFSCHHKEKEKHLILKKGYINQNTTVKEPSSDKQSSTYHDAYPKEGFSTYLENLRTYLAKNQLIKKLKISGNINVEFVVDTNGRCKNISIINGFKNYPKVNETIMNAIIIAGEWNPATDNNGKKHTVRKTIPIRIN